ncbi:hypothetical protein RO3G_12083 [Lichtheimia corymbifera JMRC:FSU:9682]|uniref:CCHC-type domain-containing protein n=1 Tax=Lichtheimia corymbifera JMRC:FSU:9682 TaxID=1263082 RepID=A0A068SIJ8_9FUNG|nr:hypothetical protein RO3G_12083 [Lichtheimia corymbifera JMRC:FSU:9682]
MSQDNARSVQSNLSESGRRKIAKFLSEPKDFSGTTNTNPLTWLRQLDRIKRVLNLEDDEILLVAASHLVGRAGLWWDSVETSITTWARFSKEFKHQFAVSLEDRWWSQIQTRVQGEDETVDDVALSLQELFRLVNVDDQVFHVRCFVQALKQDISFELEKSGIPKTWDETVDKARKIELVMSKYKRPGFTTTSLPYHDVPNPTRGSAGSVISSGASATSDIGSTLSELVNGMRDLKINLVDQPKQGQRKNPIKCFSCGELGHKSTECSKSNQGKDNGRQ